MARRKHLQLATTATLALCICATGCQEDDEGNPPPLLTQGGMETEGGLSAGTSGAGTGSETGDSTSGNVDPCPGYGSYRRDFAVWAVLFDDNGGPPRLQSDTSPQARCAQVTQCLSFDPDTQQSDIAGALNSACEAFTVDELKQLGFFDEGSYKVAEAICTTLPSVFSTDNIWDLAAYESGLAACGESRRAAA